MTKMIERNTTIPTRRSEIFTTADSNQPSVEIHVLQGERTMANDNKSLGKFLLTGIPPAPMGVPQIEVTFDIDANGIVNVSAKDLATGKQQAMTITGGTALDGNEIDQMVRDAEQYAEEDRKKRETVETRNQADQLVHQTEKLMAEQSEQLTEEEKSALETALSDLRAVLENQNADSVAVREKMDAAIAASQQMATRLYQEAAERAQQGEDAAGDEDDDVVEAEIVEDEDE